MGKHRHRSRSPEDHRDSRSHKSRKYKRERSHSRSPERRHRRDEVKSSKWDDSPDRNRNRDHRRHEPSGSRNYDRDREANRDRKMDHHRRRRRNDDDDGNYEWGKRDDRQKDESPEKEKEKPNFGLSGKLAEDTNKVNGVVIKYAEPPEARIPKKRWRLYPFKGEQSLPTLYIHRQSCYLIGRDRKICDIPVDHPSCSKQHAALQYRLMPYERNDGTEGKRVIPYIIDLESANGTFLNNKPIEAKKYHQLMEKDVLKFGFSTREYVILTENAKDDEDDFAAGSPGVEVKQERD
ncbi:smad nuclear-interacting protein 1-like [Culicoides brevitarsis]|uniref:smad nuclear-interacting protein 1-like n=1 Tax=Culicoides brevitarsis TaxID=469753 RepID=UPI00307C9323